MGGFSSQSTTIEIGEQDDDLDGLTDEEEEEYATDPNNPDSDGDGLLDGEEVYQYETQPDNPDSDGDGLLDGEDILCDPHISDVDEDGIGDWKEGTSDLDGDGIINCLDDDSDGDGHADAFETGEDIDQDGLINSWIPIRIMMGFLILKRGMSIQMLMNYPICGMKTPIMMGF